MDCWEIEMLETDIPGLHVPVSARSDTGNSLVIPRQRHGYEQLTGHHQRGRPSPVSLACRTSVINVQVFRSRGNAMQAMCEGLVGCSHFLAAVRLNESVGGCRFDLDPSVGG